VTWVDGSNGNTVNSGSSGAVVSSTNSLVGTSPTDYVGSYGIYGFIELPGNGNLVVLNATWNGSAGAATWMNGKTGALMTGAFGGAISSANSLVGTASFEQAGSHVAALTNGNYLLTDFNYASGAGAVVFGNGATGVAGNVSAANSLVGSLTTDNVGLGATSSVGIDILANGNYLVRSPNWNNFAGAVTFGNGSTGTVGAVSASNSLIGSTGGTPISGLPDRVGLSPVTLLPGSNYVVTSSAWSQPTGFAHVGAVTWSNGSTGTVGAITSSNSLIGSTANDQVGYYGITVLSNGNYVVNSPSWNNGGTVANAGAVTWGNGSGGTVGVVSATNSLVGSAASDSVGNYGVTVLANGNYVVNSPGWNGGFGAVTWGNGAVGTTGAVSVTNSLVGSTAGDSVGIGGVTVLANSNYVVSSYAWNGGFGAVTWGNGSVGTIGAVSPANSLVGSTAGDNIGNSVFALTNGNYVVSSYSWNGGFGAVTWGNGSGGTVGAVTATNSLVGSTVFDNVGSSGGIGNFVELSNGNFVVSDYGWGSPSGVLGTGLGSVTWMNGANGKLADGTSGGAISAANSLVGSTPGDLVGSSCDCSSSGYVISLSDGNYAVISPSWTNGLLSGAGAATMGNGAAGSVGVVSAANSLVGTAASEHLGSGAFELIGQPGKVLIGSAAANNGKGGVFLLGGAASSVTGYLFADSPGVDATIGADLIASTLNAGTNMVLQANNDITQLAGAAINATGSSSLTLQAGRSVVLNDVINIKGALDITANDPGAIQQYRSLGIGVLLDTSLAPLTASQVSLTNFAGDVSIGTIHGGAGAVTVVAAGGGNFISNSGSSTPITTSGKISVYSTDPSLDTLNGMGSNFHRYNCTYSAGGPVCGTLGTDITATGTGFFYSFAPALTVAANAASKTYGIPDASVLTYSVTAGYLPGDTAANAPMAGSLSHIGTEDVGPAYSITQGTLANQMGYGINFISSSLSITPATLTVAANAASKILRTADPLLTYMVAGLKLSDTDATTLSGALARLPGEAVGTYPINQGTLALISTNYTMTYVPASFTIMVPTVINEIVNTSLLFSPDMGSAQSTSSEDQKHKPKPENVVIALDTSNSNGTNLQSLPVCH
jgi:hypothetical protein